MNARASALAAAGPHVMAVAFGRRGAQWDWDHLADTTVTESGPWALDLGTPTSTSLKKVMPVFDELALLRFRDTRKLSPKVLGALLEQCRPEELGLVYGQLHKLDALAFPDSLQHLSLDSAKPHPDVVDALARLPRLEHLDLSYFPLDSPAELEQLQALRALELRGWSEVPDDLARLEGLTELDAWQVAKMDVSALSALALERLSTTAEHTVAALETFPLRGLGFPCDKPPSAALRGALAGSQLRELTLTVCTCDVRLMDAVLSMPVERLHLGTLTREAMERLIDHPEPIESLTLQLLDDRTSPEDLALAVVRRPGLRALTLVNWRISPAFAAATAARPELTYLDASADDQACGALAEAGWRPRRGGMWWVR